jgi:hypothetical protein
MLSEKKKGGSSPGFPRLGANNKQRKIEINERRANDFSEDPQHLGKRETEQVVTCTYVHRYK